MQDHIFRFFIFSIFMLASFFISACSEPEDSSIVVDSTAVRYDDIILPYDHAEKLGDFLKQEGFTDSIVREVEVEKEAQVWLIRMEVDEDIMEMSEMEVRFALLAADISRVIFNRELVEIHLCGRGMTTVKIIQAAYGFRHKIAVNGVEVYFDGDIIKYEEALAMGEYLNSIGFAEDAGLVSQLSKENEVIIFRIVFDQHLVDDPGIENVFSLLASQLSREHFYGKPLEIHLCDGNFITQKIVKADPKLSQVSVYGHIRIYYDGNKILANEVKQLGYYLHSIGFAEEQQVSVQLDQDDNAWMFRMVTNEELWHDDEYHALVEGFVNMLAAEFFLNELVEFHICDGVFVTQVVIPSQAPAAE